MYMFIIRLQKMNNRGFISPKIIDWILFSIRDKFMTVDISEPKIKSDNMNLWSGTCCAK